MKHLIRLLFLIGAFAVFGVVSANAQCVVHTSGSRLNVRDTPHGRIVNKLYNGDRVRIIRYSTDRYGENWALVSVRGRTLGWVDGEFIDCFD